jgi:hypothetical protein
VPARQIGSVPRLFCPKLTGSRPHRRAPTATDQLRRRHRLRLRKEAEATAWPPRRVPVAVAPQRRSRNRARTHPRKAAQRRRGRPTEPPDLAARPPAQQRERDPDARPGDHRQAGCVVRTARSSCHPSSSSSSRVSPLGRGRPGASATPYAAPPATATADQPPRLPAPDSGIPMSAGRASRHLSDLWVMSDVGRVSPVAPHPPVPARTSESHRSDVDPSHSLPPHAMRSVYRSVDHRR